MQQYGGRYWPVGTIDLDTKAVCSGYDPVCPYFSYIVCAIAGQGPDCATDDKGNVGFGNTGINNVGNYNSGNVSLGAGAGAHCHCLPGCSSSVLHLLSLAAAAGIKPFRQLLCLCCCNCFSVLCLPQCLPASQPVP